MVGAIVVIATSGATRTAAHTRFAAVRIRPVRTSVTLAALTALCFGTLFFASGKASGMDALWVVAISRMIPLACGLVVCLRKGNLIPPRPAWRWIVAFGLLDLAGYVAYIEGAREDLVVAAVAASQYAAIAAVGGVLGFGERLSRAQVAGVVLLVGGAAGVASQAG